MTLGDLIHDARTRRSRPDGPLNQEQLASLVGVERSSISKWESGKSYPEFPTLIKLVAILDIDIREVSDGQLAVAS